MHWLSSTWQRSGLFAIGRCTFGTCPICSVDLTIHELLAKLLLKPVHSWLTNSHSRMYVVFSFYRISILKTKVWIHTRSSWGHQGYQGHKEKVIHTSKISIQQSYQCYQGQFYLDNIDDLGGLIEKDDLHVLIHWHFCLFPKIHFRTIIENCFSNLGGLIKSDREGKVLEPQNLMLVRGQRSHH